MKIPYNILIQIKMSVRPYFKGFTLIFFFYNCRKQDSTTGTAVLVRIPERMTDLWRSRCITPHNACNRAWNVHPATADRLLCVIARTLTLTGNDHTREFDS